MTRTSRHVHVHRVRPVPHRVHHVFFGLFGAIGGAITGLSNGDASLLSGALGMGSIGLILIVAGLITNIVLMCLPSNPDGARFD